MTVKLAAAAVPKLTALAPVKPLPMITAVVPPDCVPDVGVTSVTLGAAAAVTTKWSAATIADVPLGVTTRMSTVAATWGGEMAMMVVSLMTQKAAAATVPKLIADAPVNAVPVIVVKKPPAEVPVEGLTAVTVGVAAAVTVKWSAVPTADVPVGVCTTMS